MYSTTPPLQSTAKLNSGVCCHPVAIPLTTIVSAVSPQPFNLHVILFHHRIDFGDSRLLECLWHDMKKPALGSIQASLPCTPRPAQNITHGHHQGLHCFQFAQYRFYTLSHFFFHLTSSTKYYCTNAVWIDRGSKMKRKRPYFLFLLIMCIDEAIKWEHVA